MRFRGPRTKPFNFTCVVLPRARSNDGLGARSFHKGTDALRACPSFRRIVRTAHRDIQFASESNPAFGAPVTYCK